MVKRKTMDEDTEEELLSIIMAGIGMVLASKPGAKINTALDRECAVNVLAALEDEGFKVVRNADRT